MAVLPPQFKSLQHYLKTAQEHATRDPIVAYYCKLYALQLGMKIDKKSAECVKFLTQLMDELETAKKALKDDEAITTELVGQAHVENYALRVFLFADGEDRAASFSKNVVKSFYTAGMLYDVLTNFGELNEEDEHRRKYAKWKAAYIHNCLKSGDTPIAGPVGSEMEEGTDDVNKLQPPGPSSTSSLQPPGSTYPTPGPTYPTPGPTYPTPGPTYPTPGPTYPTPGPTYPTPGSEVTSTHRPVSPSVYQQPDASTMNSNTSTNVADLEASKQAQKWCKFAISALEYQDSATAINYLEKTLKLLTTGEK